MHCKILIDASLFLLLLLQIASGKPVRTKRRATPRLDRPLTLVDLRFECCSHPWINCCLETTALLNSNSTANRGHEQCLQEARRQHQVTVAAVVQRGAVQEAATKTGGENAVSIECSLSGDQKADARKTYCDYFRVMDAQWTYYYLRNMYSLANCVRHFNSSQFRSPQQVVEGIALWHGKWTRRQRCCHPFVPPRTSPISPGSCTKKVQSATTEWDEHLVKVAIMMHKVDMLKSYGRINKCLRGCVSEQEVQCVDIFT